MLDVSDHPDIADLYLAADVLVSDYSSAIYDFAVTGKPILLFAPDLDRYRDDVRGMYFDYEDWAPGPVSATQEDLAAGLVDLDGVVARLRRSLPRTSCERFCPHEDGARQRAGRRSAALSPGLTPGRAPARRAPHLLGQPGVVRLEVALEAVAQLR